MLQKQQKKSALEAHQEIQILWICKLRGGGESIYSSIFIKRNKFDEHACARVLYLRTGTPLALMFYDDTITWLFQNKQPSLKFFPKGFHSEIFPQVALYTSKAKFQQQFVLATFNLFEIFFRFNATTSPSFHPDIAAEPVVVLSSLIRSDECTFLSKMLWITAWVKLRNVNVYRHKVSHVNFRVRRCATQIRTSDSFPRTLTESCRTSWKDFMFFRGLCIFLFTGLRSCIWRTLDLKMDIARITPNK